MELSISLLSDWTAKMLNPNYCYICKRENVLLASLYAPGIYFMCDDCIKEQEEITGEVAVFGPRGLEFVSPERAKELIKNES